MHSEPYNKICFDIIHIHCNKQLFFVLTVSIDTTEELSVLIEQKIIIRWQNFQIKFTIPTDQLVKLTTH